jgi:hypothetical protein
MNTKIIAGVTTLVLAAWVVPVNGQEEKKPFWDSLYALQRS